MELILKTDNEEQIAMIIAFAKKFNILVESKESDMKKKHHEKEALRQRILNFQAKSSPTIVDPIKWQQEQREDRNLPFSK